MICSYGSVVTTSTNLAIPTANNSTAFGSVRTLEARESLLGCCIVGKCETRSFFGRERAAAPFDIGEQKGDSAGVAAEGHGNPKDAIALALSSLMAKDRSIPRWAITLPLCGC
jgi:hypothetical protein